MTSPARIPLVLGNWKMNTTLDEAETLALAIDQAASSHPEIETGILPPAPWIVPLADRLGRDAAAQIGVQDISPEASGAYTGDISAEMVAPYTRYMLVGHSERRHGHGEPNELIRAKLDAVYRVDRIPVLAVGETEAERSAGKAADVVSTQLMAALQGRTSSQLGTLVVAYEPVWAIGTGKAATPEDASEMASGIRELLHRLDQSVAERIRILYGGSVKGNNAGDFFAVTDIDGGLVGGASLDSDDFGAILSAAGRPRA